MYNIVHGMYNWDEPYQSYVLTLQFISVMTLGKLLAPHY